MNLYNIPMDLLNAALGTEKCEICSSGKNLALDHCHLTGAFRGVLCVKCNTLLGRLGDTADGVLERVTMLLKYLKAGFKIVKVNTQPQ